MQDATELDILDPDECRRLLTSASIGRVVFTEQALPTAQPVTFVVLDDHIVIRTRPGSRLAMAAPNAIMAFQADDIDVDKQCGWNVTVVGPADIVDDPLELTELAQLPLRTWAPGIRDTFIRIRIDLLRGRRLAGS